MSEDAYLDAILVFTPKAAERLVHRYNRDPRKNSLGVGPGNLCGIYVSDKSHQALEYSAEVGRVMQTTGAGLLIEEVIGMLTFTPEEARKYIKPEEKYYLITLGNVREIEPIPLRVLKDKHKFNPWSGIKRYSGGERPKVKIL